MKSYSLVLADADQTAALGAALAEFVEPMRHIFVTGELGAGKTTLIRGLLRQLGYGGRIKSPTYTLVEPYAIDGLNIYHCDFYRLAVAEELEFIGIRDFLDSPCLLLVEWAAHVRRALPEPGFEIVLDYQALPRSGRSAILSVAGPMTPAEACLLDDRLSAFG